MVELSEEQAPSLADQFKNGAPQREVSFFHLQLGEPRGGVLATPRVKRGTPAGFAVAAVKSEEKGKRGRGQ